MCCSCTSWVLKFVGSIHFFQSPTWSHLANKNLRFQWRRWGNPAEKVIPNSICWGVAKTLETVGNLFLICVVVSNIFYFHPYLGKWSNLTNIFQMGWNHQLVMKWSLIKLHYEHQWTSMCGGSNIKKHHPNNEFVCMKGSMGTLSNHYPLLQCFGRAQIIY